MNQPVEQPNQTVNDDEAEFEPLKGFESDYEIQKDYPFVIRKKVNHRIIKEGINNYGYPRVYLNCEPYLKHVIVAKQFLENTDPEHKTQIDHINKIRTDYHISNLRYVSPSENSQNRTVSTANTTIRYEYVDNISDEAIVVDEYNGHQFNDYYFHDNVFYFFNGIQYRKLHINTDKRNGNLYVNMKDNDGKTVKIMYSMFKRLHDLL